jgi:DNA-binding NtrC family response regulator
MVWHMAKTVLIVDDDPTQRRLMQAAAEKQGFRARVVENGDRALEEASDARHGVDVVLLDLVMPGLSGQDTLQRLIERRPDLPVIVVTATGGIDTVVQAMRAGAVDFFVNPASPERIAISIRNALKLSDLRGEVKRLVKKTEGRMGFEDMIASAPAMRGVVRLGQRAASSSIPILILGESGVGKEVIARCIQGASERAGKPFISVNCGAIPENLVESILFGHEKGSFTGATDKKLGKFVEADGGTLFLDEVGELTLEMQVKLLRVLQEGEVDAVGSRRPTKIDVRIISATNRDPQEAVQQGLLREDLFYRLRVVPIKLPPLRKRLEDIPLLAEFFLKRSWERHRASGPPPALTADTITFLQTRPWRGNVRELQNVIEHVAVIAEAGRPIEPADIPVYDEAPMAGVEQGLPAAIMNEAFHTAKDNLIAHFEKEYLSRLTTRAGGNMSKAARLAGIDRTTLYRLMEKHGFRRDVLSGATD